MKSIIAKMYENEHPAIESILDSEEYCKGMTEFCEYADNFKNGLTDNQKEVFEKLEALRDEMEYNACLTRYVEGLKFGLKVGMEAAED